MKKKKNNSTSIAKVAVAAAAVVGGAVIAAKALQDKGNQEKIKKGINKAREVGDEALTKLSDSDAVKELQKRLSELQSELEKKFKSAQKTEQYQKFEAELSKIGDKIKSEIEKPDGTFAKSKTEIAKLISGLKEKIVNSK